MKINKYIAATGVISMALMSAAPVFAEDTHGTANFGGTVSALAHQNEGDNASSTEHGIGKMVSALAHAKKDAKKAKNATTTVSVMGTVTAISSTTITLSGKKGALYSVNAANATLTADEDAVITLGSIKVGDKLKVKGSLSGSVITATKITDKSVGDRDELTHFDGVRLGVVTSISGNLLTINRLGTGTTSVMTSASTVYLVQGAATTSSAVHVGSNVLVLGPTTVGADNSITASTVMVVSISLDYLKKLIR